jgi:hypothetical protein
LVAEQDQTPPIQVRCGVGRIRRHEPHAGEFQRIVKKQNDLITVVKQDDALKRCEVSKAGFGKVFRTKAEACGFLRFL